MYAFKSAKKSRLFESLTGSRMMCNYMRFGGCRWNVSTAWLDAARKVDRWLPQFCRRVSKALLSSNEILMARCRAWAFSGLTWP